MILVNTVISRWSVIATVGLEGEEPINEYLMVEAAAVGRRSRESGGSINNGGGDVRGWGKHENNETLDKHLQETLINNSHIYFPLNSPHL
jgi:hypothetical protein